MATIADTLSELKTIVSDIDPTPQLVPTRVSVYPDDVATMFEGEPPLVVISQVINERDVFTELARGAFEHRWIAEVAVLLHKGTLVNLEAAAAAEAKQAPWYVAMLQLLAGNRGVNGTVLTIGEGNTLFSMQTGNLGWDATHVFYGIAFHIPIVQAVVSL